MAQFQLPKNSRYTEGNVVAEAGQFESCFRNSASIAGIRTTAPIRRSTPITSTVTIAGRWFSTP